MTQRTNRLQSQYSLIRDCLDGDDAIKDGGQTYLPKPEGMTTQNYTNYSQRACYYGAPAMTLQALTGLALRKDPVIKLPARLEPVRLNATHDNAPLNILIEDMAREVMTMGRFGLLLDFPATGNSINTVPHFSTFSAETIEEFETSYVDGKKVLTSVHLSSDEQHDGANVHYELILEAGVYQFRRFVRDDKDNRVDVGENHIPVVNGKPLNFIPFIMVSHQGTRPENITPPFWRFVRSRFRIIRTRLIGNMRFFLLHHLHLG